MNPIDIKAVPVSPTVATDAAPQITRPLDAPASPVEARTEAQWQQITDAFRDLGPAVQCRIQLSLDPAKMPASVDAVGKQYYVNALQTIGAMLDAGVLTFDPATRTLVAANNLVALQRFIPGGVVWPVGGRVIAAVGFSLVPPEFEIELTPAGTTAFENLLGGAAAGVGPGLIALGLPPWAAGAMAAAPLAIVKAVHALSAKNAVKLSFVPTPPAGFICIPEPA